MARAHKEPEKHLAHCTLSCTFQHTNSAKFETMDIDVYYLDQPPDCDRYHLDHILRSALLASCNTPANLSSELDRNSQLVGPRPHQARIPLEHPPSCDQI
jgi:hypothetical protein